MVFKEKKIKVMSFKRNSKKHHFNIYKKKQFKIKPDFIQTQVSRLPG
jgi:hypothetical protein